MPELSRPLIVIIGVVISIAVLFLAIAGFLPFFSATVTTTTQTASFSATGSGTYTATGTNTYRVVLTINVQKMVGTGQYNIEIDKVYNGKGQEVSTYSTSGDFSITDSTAGFTITINNVNGDYLHGNWIVVLKIKTGGRVIQTMTVTITM